VSGVKYQGITINFYSVHSQCSVRTTVAGSIRLTIFTNAALLINESISNVPVNVLNGGMLAVVEISGSATVNAAD